MALHMLEGSLGSEHARIRQRDALPSPVHEIEMPEICFIASERAVSTTPGPGYESGAESTADAAPGRQTTRELGYGITDTWDDLVGAIQEIAPTTLEGVNQRVIKDRPFHRRTALLMDEEARLSRAAWARSMDACDQAADRRRQMVITDLLKADYRRQRQLVETLKIVKSLKTHMIELQRQQGPAKGVLQSQRYKRRPVAVLDWVMTVAMY
ncbi:hypothetical protein Tco_0668986 [Tanacetum coccineum]